MKIRDVVDKTLVDVDLTFDYGELLQCSPPYAMLIRDALTASFDAAER